MLNQFYFSFFDVPDLIVKMAPNKNDYAKMIEFLNVAKHDYIREKAEIMKKPVDQIRITDEDLVPLELIRQTLAQLKHKFNSKCDYISDFIEK